MRAHDIFSSSSEIVRPMKTILRIVFAMALALVATTLPSMANAQAAPPAAPSQQAKDEAQDRFKRGIELYEEENFSAALVEFKRAYELVPAYQVLYNVGRTCYQLRDYVCALRTFDRYLSEGGSGIEAKRKEEVEREMVSMRRRVTTINVTATKGATISIDGINVGDAPFPAPIQANEGRRLLRATMAGRESVEKPLELTGGSTIAVDLTFPEPGAGAVASTSRASGSSSNTHWWLWGATGVLAVGAGITGTLALSASGDASDIRERGGSLSDYDSAESRMRSFTVVTDVLAIAAIGVGITALVFTLTNDSKSSSPTAKASAKSSKASVSPTGFLYGRF